MTELLALLPAEPETTRVVTILGEDGRPKGAGCLVDGKAILTCAHVVASAFGVAQAEPADIGRRVQVDLGGVRTQPRLNATLAKLGDPAVLGRWRTSDLALLRLDPADSARLRISAVDLAAPMSHSGKKYSVMGFPEHHDYGYHSSGTLRATDRTGLVQMDGESLVGVSPGFSGAPVWSPDLQAFVGIAVAAEGASESAWLIPSRVLAMFLPSLSVKFRIPPPDRPVLHDWDLDDPNIWLFGEIPEQLGRRLTATVTERKGYYDVNVYYEVLDGAAPARGEWVTFITYPDFKKEMVDGYELFGRVEKGRAEQSLEPIDLFTIAAIGDGGDTVLTLNLWQVFNEAEAEKKKARKQRK